MAYQTIVTNTSGAVRKFSYLPPNGRTLGIGESMIIDGILDTILNLGKPRRFREEYAADTAAGEISSQYPAIAQELVYPTTNYNLSAFDGGKVFNNKDAPGNITLTLPASPVSLSFQPVCFIVGVPFELKVKAAGGGIIQYGDSIGGANSEIASTDAGAVLWLRIATPTTWLVDSIIGGWSEPV